MRQKSSHFTRKKLNQHWYQEMYKRTNRKLWNSNVLVRSWRQLVLNTIPSPLTFISILMTIGDQILDLPLVTYSYSEEAHTNVYDFCSNDDVTWWASKYFRTLHCLDIKIKTKLNHVLYITSFQEYSQCRFQWRVCVRSRHILCSSVKEFWKSWRYKFHAASKQSLCLYFELWTFHWCIFHADELEEFTERLLL